ncbi:MAG TPA: epoxyqueuosine reductase [Desulfobacteraceae bacterium]|nr:epoxyqueuosine reductase [Desulfobacteraceae bacterium]
MEQPLFRKWRLPWRHRMQPSSRGHRELSQEVVQKAVSLGASLAGIADADALGASPSHRAQPVRWPPGARSAIVLALAHPPQQLQLDCWDGQPGGTPGNRRLIRSASALVRWLRQRHGTAVRIMPYQIEQGGVFLKDAAVLAGLGVMGRNNLVVTPEFGPRIRLRVILATAPLAPTGPLADFSPCEGCPEFCRRACPQDAFRSGRYDQRCCLCQMWGDENGATSNEDGSISYCRICEMACPVGA